MASTDGETLFASTKPMAELSMVPVSFFPKVDIDSDAYSQKKEEVFQI